jgi:hypothetical protein
LSSAGAPSEVAPESESTGSEAPRRQRPLSELLVVAGLCGLAVVQPLLDLFGKSPTALQGRGVEGTQILLFAIGVVVVPPVVLWLVGVASARIDRRLGWWVHVATVAALFAMVGVLLAKALTEASAVHAVVGVAAAVGGTWAYLRIDGVYLWLRVLSIANVAFLGSFVFLAPVSVWITDGSQTAADASFQAAGAGGQPASLVMVVLDELPTQSIITGDETIDPVRFPNLARFAGEATWYRHFSTVSPFTQSAVPALLDGRDPHGEPVWTDHPDNLFSLLANTHHLTVSESLTKLCGFEACSGPPLPPPGADPEAAEIAAPVTEWRGLLGDARDLWFDRVTPGRSSSGEALDDFAEDLRSPGPSSAETNGGVVDVPESQQLDGFFASSGAVQPTRLDAFLDAVQPTDEPFFGFLHLVLPHQPWFSREDGTRYATPGTYEGPDIASPWRARVTRQRHLLQAQYADLLVGQILAHLHEVGEYDDSLVVVVSDHGASFEPGESVRSIEDENLDDIAYSPLLVKAPGQTAGQVDDSNLLSVDLVPTIAELLGTEPTWEVDGVPADDTAALADRGDDKYVYSYTDAFTYDFLGIEEFSDRDAYPAMVAGRFPSVRASEDPIAALYRGRPGADLIGEPAATVFRPGSDEALVRDLDELQDPNERELLAEVIGVAPDADVGDTVVVAVNGEVVGVSPVFDDPRADRQFVVLLPAGALDDGENRIQAGVLAADGERADELDLVDSD